MLKGCIKQLAHEVPCTFKQGRVIARKSWVIQQTDDKAGLLAAGVNERRRVDGDAEPFAQTLGTNRLFGYFDWAASYRCEPKMCFLT